MNSSLLLRSLLGIAVLTLPVSAKADSSSGSTEIANAPSATNESPSGGAEATPTEKEDVVGRELRGTRSAMVLSGGVALLLGGGAAGGAWALGRSSSSSFGDAIGKGLGVVVLDGFAAGMLGGAGAAFGTALLAPPESLDAARVRGHRMLVAGAILIGVGFTATLAGTLTSNGGDRDQELALAGGGMVVSGVGAGLLGGGLLYRRLADHLEQSSTTVTAVGGNGYRGLALVGTF
jgi:hypothetical protein